MVLCLSDSLLLAADWAATPSEVYSFKTEQTSNYLCHKFSCYFFKSLNSRDDTFCHLVKIFSDDLKILVINFFNSNKSNSFLYLILTWKLAIWIHNLATKNNFMTTRDMQLNDAAYTGN